jgi:hypothetical protein
MKYCSLLIVQSINRLCIHPTPVCLVASISGTHSALYPLCTVLCTVRCTVLYSALYAALYCTLHCTLHCTLQCTHSALYTLGALSIVDSIIEFGDWAKHPRTNSHQWDKQAGTGNRDTDAVIDTHGVVGAVAIHADASVYAMNLYTKNAAKVVQSIDSTPYSPCPPCECCEGSTIS